MKKFFEDTIFRCLACRSTLARDTALLISNITDSNSKFLSFDPIGYAFVVYLRNFVLLFRSFNNIC
jgi:hypothetical protein